jgi:hypothetical protein
MADSERSKRAHSQSSSIKEPEHCDKVYPPSPSNILFDKKTIGDNPI